MSLTRENVLGYLNRDWDGARKHKDASMGRWVQVKGTGAALRLSDMLLAQVWERARQEKSKQDFSGLISMRRKLDRAHAAATSRKSKPARR